MDIRDFSLDLFQLDGKVAIVTGGNTGLGLSYSMALAKAGANIFIPSFMDDKGEAKALIEKETGREVEFMQADLTQDGMCQKAVEACVKRFGRVDILINNAGMCINEPDVLKFDRAKWDKMIALNLTAAFDMSHEVAKFMIPQKSGKIVNICSMFSWLGGQWSPAYASTKHGIAGLTKAYCDELAQFGIQVNGLAPGYYATPLTAATREDKVANQRVLSHIAAGRWGVPYDLMGPMLFLCSPAADYVNGHVLTVDGGYLVR